MEYESEVGIELRWDSKKNGQSRNWREQRANMQSTDQAWSGKNDTS